MIEVQHIIPGKARPLFPERIPKRTHHIHGYINTESLLKAVSRYLPWKPTIIKPIHDGKGSCLFKIVDNGRKAAVLKIGMFGDHHESAHEVLFHNLESSYLSPPCLNVYVLDYSGEIIPYPNLLREWVEGESIIEKASNGKLDKIDAVFRQIGRRIRLIHDIDYPVLGYGLASKKILKEFIYSKSIPDVIIGQYESVKNHYEELVRKAVYSLSQHAMISKKDRLDINSLVNNWSPDTTIRLCILHGDCSMGNIIFKNNELTGIIDGSSYIGYDYEELADIFLYLFSLTVHFPSVSIEKSFNSFCTGYDIDAQLLIEDFSFRFFLTAKLVNHLRILIKMERTAYVNHFLSLLHRILKHAL